MNSNNLEKQKKRLLTYFKENRFEEVIDEENNENFYIIKFCIY